MYAENEDGEIRLVERIYITEKLGVCREKEGFYVVEAQLVKSRFANGQFVALTNAFEKKEEAEKAFRDIKDRLRVKGFLITKGDKDNHIHELY